LTAKFKKLILAFFLVICLLAIPLATAYDSPASEQFFYRMNDTDNTITDYANSFTGQGENLTFGVNGVSRTQGNWDSGKAIRFEGDQLSFIDTGYNPSNSTNEMTLSAWVYPIESDVNDNSRVMSDGSIEMKINGDTRNQIKITVLHPSGEYTDLTYQPVDYGQWSHLVATYDGSSVILYKNGTQVASKSVTLDIRNSADNFAVGTNLHSGGELLTENFGGRIDEPRVYERALTSTEVDNLFQYNQLSTPDANDDPVFSDLNFQVLDSFEDQDLSEYSGDTSSFDFVTNPVFSGQYSLRGSSDSENVILRDQESWRIDSTQNLSVRIYPDATSSFSGIILGKDSSNYYLLDINQDANELRLLKTVGGSSSFFKSTTEGTISNGQFYRMVFNRNFSSGRMNGYLYDSDNVLVSNISYVDQSISNAYHPGIHDYNTLYYDNFGLLYESTPDLNIDSISFNPANPSLNEEVDISVDVSNNEGSLSNCYATVYRGSSIVSNNSLSVSQSSCSGDNVFSSSVYGAVEVEVHAKTSNASTVLNKTVEFLPPETDISGFTGSSKYVQALDNQLDMAQDRSAYSSGWSTLWENATTVWNAGASNYDSHFYWDSAMGAWGASYRTSNVAEAVGELNFMTWQIEKFGYVPNLITQDGTYSQGRSQPPFYVTTGVKAFKRTNRTDIACQTYEYGKKELGYWRNQNIGDLPGMDYNRPRYDPQDNLYHYDSGTGTGDTRLLRTIFESGRDTSPIWNTPSEKAYEVYPTGLNSLMYYNYQKVAKLGSICDNRTSKDISNSTLDNLRYNASSIKTAMNNKMWNESDDWYYNYDDEAGSAITGKKTLADAWVLYSGMLNETRAEKVADTLQSNFFDGYVTPPETDANYDCVSHTSCNLWLHDTSFPPTKSLVYQGLTKYNLGAFEDFKNYYANIAIGREYLTPTTGAGDGADQMAWGYATAILPAVNNVFGIGFEPSNNLLKVKPTEPPIDGASGTFHLGILDHANVSFQKNSSRVKYTVGTVKSHDVRLLMYFNRSYGLGSPEVTRDGASLSSSNYELESLDSDSDKEGILLNSSIGSTHTFTLSTSSTDTNPPKSSDNWTASGFVDKSSATVEISASDSGGSGVANISYSPIHTTATSMQQRQANFTTSPR